jgi:hypothetical protein
MHAYVIVMGSVIVYMACWLTRVHVCGEIVDSTSVEVERERESMCVSMKLPVCASPSRERTTPPFIVLL